MHDDGIVPVSRFRVDATIYFEGCTLQTTIEHVIRTMIRMPVLYRVLMVAQLKKVSTVLEVKSNQWPMDSQNH